MTMDGYDASQRLAVYGSLAPGKRNAHILEPLGGKWTPAIVHGHLRPILSGEFVGYNIIELAEDGDPVPCLLFSSRDLPAFWDQLDAFEGPAYVRTITRVRVGDAVVEANIYEDRALR